MRTEIQTKTQVHNAGPHSNPFQQSRNVFIVSNDEDRPGRSFDDLFEDPGAEQHQAPPETRDSKPIEFEQESAGWDEYDLPDFVTPDDLSPAEPAAIEPHPTTVVWPAAAGGSLPSAGKCVNVHAADGQNLFSAAKRTTEFTYDVVY